MKFGRFLQKFSISERSSKFEVVFDGDKKTLLFFRNNKVLINFCWFFERKTFRYIYYFSNSWIIDSTS